MYVAFAAFLVGEKAPAPPVQLPPAAAVAAKVTGVLPQVLLSGPALAVTGLFIVIVTASDAILHGPLPSGSGIFHVKVIVFPISENAGV